MKTFMTGKNEAYEKLSEILNTSHKRANEKLS
jgi:hypothetical protein